MDESEDFETSNFFGKILQKFGSNFLVHLAGQISENSILEFLKGSQFKKWAKLSENPNFGQNSRNFFYFFEFFMVGFSPSDFFFFLPKCF